MPRKKTKGKKVAKIARKKVARFTKIVPVDKKVKIIVKNLIWFGTLFILSLLLYNFLIINEFISDLFFVSVLLTGFIEVSLVIAYLVFFFLKIFKK